MKNIYLQEIWLGTVLNEYAYRHNLPFYYEDTEHYRITKGYLNSPQRYLNELFKE